MDKVLKVLLRNIETIVFAVLMVVLIVIIWLQTRRIDDAKKAIAQVQSITAPKNKQPKPVRPIDAGIFDLKTEVSEEWRPAYTFGKWKEYAAAGDPMIFRKHRKPPIQDERYKEYLIQYGPGSLFDPPLLVYPLNKKPNLLGFESVHHYESPYPKDYPTIYGESEDSPEKNGEDANKVAQSELGTLVRLVKVQKPYMNFALTSVVASDLTDNTTWSFFFSIMSGGRKRPLTLRVGDDIKGTGYQVIDAKHERVMINKGGVQVPDDIYNVTLAFKDDPEIRINVQKGKKLIDPKGTNTYELAFFPSIKGRIRKRAGEEVELSHDGIEATYTLTLENGQPQLVSDNSDPIIVPKYNRDEHKKWYKEYKDRQRGSASGSAGAGAGGMPDDLR